LPCVCPARESIAHHQTVLDNALLLQAIAGADGIDDRQQAGCPFPSDVPDYPALAKQGVKGLKIGILSEGLDRPLADKRVSELVIKAAEALRELGAEVEEVSVPFHKEAPDVWAVSGLSGFGLSTRLSARN
jgi:amidase